VCGNGTQQRTLQKPGKDAQSSCNSSAEAVERSSLDDASDGNLMKQAQKLVRLAMGVIGQFAVKGKTFTQPAAPRRRH
jgi:hypothetical protein